MSGKNIVYIEIPAENMDKAIEFYKSVFGWKIEESGLTDDRYAMFNTEGDEDLCVGGLDARLPVKEGGVLPYINVDDIAHTLEKIKDLGGIVIKSKEDIGKGYGYSAVFRDPNGNHIGLWSRS